jgi:hypothetical protein
MFAGCVFAMSVLALSVSDDTPKDMLVFKCKDGYRYMVDKKEVVYLDKLGSNELYIYQEKK